MGAWRCVLLACVGTPDTRAPQFILLPAIPK